MAFYDEARITVISGKGGDGCSSFRREKYIPKGGPDGGDGGKGGDVLIRLDKNLNSLISLKGKRQFSATKGKAGSGKNKKGEFNVPFGKKTTGFVSFLDTENFKNVSNALQKTTLTNYSFEKAINFRTIKPNHLIFLDPPYIPISKTANW